MKMRQLEAFYAVMLAGTLTRAAELLFTSQPSISRMLTDLEADVGFALFKRQRGRVEATPEGFAFFEELKKIYAGIDQLSEFAKTIKNKKSGHLTISSIPALSISFLPSILGEFKQMHGDAVLSVLVRGPEEILRHVEEDKTDIALCFSIPKLPLTMESTLISPNFVCALPPGHPLGEKDTITANDLADEPFIMLNAETQYAWSAHEKLISGMPIPPRVTAYTQQSAAAYGLVLSGVGISILEPFSASHWAKLGVQIRKFRPQISYPFNVFFPANKARSSLAQDLFEIIKDYSEKMPRN